MALLRPRAMSDLSPQSGPKRTSIDFMSTRPRPESLSRNARAARFQPHPRPQPAAHCCRVELRCGLSRERSATAPNRPPRARQEFVARPSENVLRERGIREPSKLPRLSHRHLGENPRAVLMPNVDVNSGGLVVGDDPIDPSGRLHRVEIALLLDLRDAVPRRQATAVKSVPVPAGSMPTIRSPYG